MKKIAYSSLAYMIFGLAAGLFYREFPRMINVVGEVQDSQLSVVHTHAFALGMFVFLFVLIFAKLFNIHKHPTSTNSTSLTTSESASAHSPCWLTAFT